MKVLRFVYTIVALGACTPAGRSLASSTPVGARSECAAKLAASAARGGTFEVPETARLLHADPSPIVPAKSGPGRFILRVVVDTLGRADVRTVQVPPGSDSGVVEAVLRVLPQWEFSPAVVEGCKARQLVQIPIEY